MLILCPLFLALKTRDDRVGEKIMQYNMLQKFKILVFLLICICTIPAAFSAETNSNDSDLNAMILETTPLQTNPATTEEALSFAERLKSIAQKIKEQKGTLLSGAALNTFNASVAT